MNPKVTQFLKNKNLWKGLGVSTGIAALAAPAIAGIPIYRDYKALKERHKKVLDRVENVKNNVVPEALLTAAGAGTISGLATYNIVQHKAMQDRNKYSAFKIACILCRTGFTKSSSGDSLSKLAIGWLGKGLIGGLALTPAVAYPLHHFGREEFNRRAAGPIKQLEEGEKQLDFIEQNANTIGAVGGTALGAAAAYAMAKNRFKTPPEQAGGYYG